MDASSLHLLAQNPQRGECRHSYHRSAHDILRTISKDLNYYFFWTRCDFGARFKEIVKFCLVVVALQEVYGGILQHPRGPCVSLFQCRHRSHCSLNEYKSVSFVQIFIDIISNQGPYHRREWINKAHKVTTTAREVLMFGQYNTVLHPAECFQTLMQHQMSQISECRSVIHHLTDTLLLWVQFEILAWVFST